MAGEVSVSTPVPRLIKLAEETESDYKNINKKNGKERSLGSFKH